MKILVTGCAGFIGYHVTHYLLNRGNNVIGIDNLDNYYDVQLKKSRLEVILPYKNFSFIKLDISERDKIKDLFKKGCFNQVIHLAAQAGVRYSLENPQAYVDSNLVGFANILEGCRYSNIKHLVYASSSSVYGANETMPFKTTDNVDHPLSFYAATKKANELMSHSYSHLYNLPITGLRFFTVYGPWGRPDMSPFLFVRAILNSETLKIFNYGKHQRDFTYIDDIVEGVIRCLDTPPIRNMEWSGKKPDPSSSKAPWKIYNIGNSKPINLLSYIKILEQAIGKTTHKEFLPMQAGDVKATYADISALENEIGYKPKITIQEGVKKFVDWYLDYYNISKLK